MPPLALDDVLAKEVCAAIGTPLPSSVDDIGALYRGWIAAVPFDPVAKAIAVREDTAVPGADPVEVCERWLATGLGSTCWGLCTGLAGLLGTAGIEARIGVERMQRDDVVDFHSFLVLDLDGEPHMVDPIHPSGEPLRMTEGAAGEHPVYRVGFEDDAGRLEHYFAHPAMVRFTELRYAVLSTVLDRRDVAAFCELSRHHSGIRTGHFFSRAFTDTTMIQVRPRVDGRVLRIIEWSVDGPLETPIDDVEAALAALGYHGEARTLIARAGYLDGDPWTPPPREDFRSG